SSRRTVRRSRATFDSAAPHAWPGPPGSSTARTASARCDVVPAGAPLRWTRVDQIAGTSFFAAFSQEQFRLVDQDVVLMYGKRSDVEGNRVVKRLDAVRDDRVVYLDLTDQFAGALGFASAL